MSNYLAVSESLIHLSIPEAITKDSVTYYKIKVSIDPYEWNVQRRFKDFVELHETLIECGVSKESLPQKKFLGNRDPSFIMKRRRELETYLISVFQFLSRALPQSLADFLDLSKYDLNYVLQTLASLHYDRLVAEVESPSGDEAHWSPLEMYSISTRLKSPLPPQDPESKRFDFTNVADCVCQLRSLKLLGLNECLGESNIIPNELPFDFLAFKSLSKLVLTSINISPEIILGLGQVRTTLKHLQANKCELTSLAHLLLCDAPHYCLKEDSEIRSATEGKPLLTWPKLEYIDVRYNAIERIDASIGLVPICKSLLFGSNKISVIENLSGLSELITLELSDNNISDTDNLNTRLGQLIRIDISHNKVKSLVGFSKLFSLRHLNVSANRISDLECVFPVRNLPELTSLNLQSNSVTSVVDYRLKVFESFGKRCAELQLDNETPSQSEVDKVSVLMALRVAREGKEPTTLFGNLPRRVN